MDGNKVTHNLSMAAKEISKSRNGLQQCLLDVYAKYLRLGPQRSPKRAGWENRWLRVGPALFPRGPAKLGLSVLKLSGEVPLIQAA
jgi:hypothetical protein